MVLNRGVHKILRNFLILKDSRGEEVVPLARLELATHGLGIRCPLELNSSPFLTNLLQLIHYFTIFKNLIKVVQCPHGFLHHTIGTLENAV